MENQETAPLVPQVSIQMECLKTLKDRVLQNDIDQNFLIDRKLNEGSKPILLSCCENRGDFSNVTPRTLQVLIDSGANIHHVNPEWYGWEPLHYAAFASNPQKLEKICENISPGRINTLTVLSENALHVLLAHGTTSVSYDFMCENGTQSKTVKIINREHENVIECAKILIDRKIDVHHPNFWNETPIMIAKKRRYAKIVDLLLNCEKTLENSSVFSLLKSGNFDAFVSYNGGNLREHLKKVDGDSFVNSSCTLLQYCFRRSLIFWYHDTKNDTHRSEDLTQDRMVEVFCKTGCAKSILHLLDQNVDTSVTLEKFEGGTTVLRAAITKGWYPIVALILDKTEDDKLEFEDITEGLKKLIEKDGCDLNNTLLIVLSRLIKCVSRKKEFLATLSLLLEKGGKKINKRNQLLLLKFPKSLTWKTTGEKESVLEGVDPEVLKTHLDNCITQGVINCDSITGGESLFSTVPPLLELYLSSSLRELLTHVVFKILIKRQWETPRQHWRFSPRYYFYANLFFYVCFYLILNAYILVKFNHHSSSSGLQICVWIFWTLFVVKELIQVVSNCKIYFKEPTNWLEMFFIICTLFVLNFNTPWIDIAEVLTVLSSNAVLLSLLMTLPTCAKYIIILRTIVLYFRYLFFYLIQFVAFTISFYILFAQSKQIWYEELANKFFDTVILFTGNLDYMDTPWKSNTTFYHKESYNEPFSKLIFIIFVFFLAIILQNLLLGLLVIDISNLQKEVALSEQMKRAAFVVRLEKIFDGFLLKSLCQLFPITDKSKGDTPLVINDNDRCVLTEDEKQQLDHVTKRVEEPDELKKLRNYIRRRVNERCDERDKDREIVEKLEMLEEMVKKLQERK